MKHEYEYPRPAVSVDILVLRGTVEDRSLLLIERKHEPFAGCWALPGGFLDEDETLEQAAARELKEETDLEAEYLQQLRAYSSPDRDPRTRVISVAFITKVASGSCAMADDAAKSKWFPVSRLPRLAFDHAQIVDDFINSDRNCDFNK